MGDQRQQHDDEASSVKGGETRAILHRNLPILDVAEPFLLDILLADAATAPYILARLSPCIAIVEPKDADTLLTRLLKLKHMPKVVEI